MARAFFYGTSLESIEQMMMSVPNFIPRKRGLFIVDKSLKEEKESIKCKYCTNYIKGCCSNEDCSYMLQRAEYGAIKYKDFTRGCFVLCKQCHLNKRLNKLIQAFDGQWFLTDLHQKRFEQVLKVQNLFEHKNEYLATLYLLTADDTLWNKSKDHIYLNTFDFNHIKLYGVDTDAYAIYQMARTIFTGINKIEINEIADESLINHFTFKAIVNSILISKYGKEVLKIRQ